MFSSYADASNPDLGNGDLPKLTTGLVEIKYGCTLKDIMKDKGTLIKVAAVATKEAASKAGISTDLKMNKDQGWNGVAFKNNTHLVKFAKGDHELKAFKRISAFKNIRGLNLCIPQCIYDVNLNGKRLEAQRDKGTISYTVQIMPFIQHDTSFARIGKRLLWGEKTWVHEKDEKGVPMYMFADKKDGLVFYETKKDVLVPKDSKGKYQFDKQVKLDPAKYAPKYVEADYSKTFGRACDLELMKRLGKAMARFQRGGKAIDEKSQHKLTTIHGDLWVEHILISDYPVHNENENPQDIKPTFSLVDTATCNQVEDDRNRLLLADPIFLSSCIALEDPKLEKKAEMIEIFEWFYMGYVTEFSKDTIQRLAKRLKDGSAYNYAEKYQASIGKGIKGSDYGNCQEIKRYLQTIHQKAFEYACKKEKIDLK